MAEPQYLSTDPRAGQPASAAAYLSTDPAAVASVPPSQFPRDAQGRLAVGGSEDAPSEMMTMLGRLAHPQTFSDFASLLMMPVDEVRSAATRALAMTAAKATPAALKTGTAAVMDAVKTAATSTTARKVAAELVKNGSTAAGAYVGGAPGAVMGSTIGEKFAGMIRPAAAEVADEGAVSVSGFPRDAVTPPPSAPPPVVAAPAPVTAAAAQSPQAVANAEALARRRALYQAAQTPAAAAEPVTKATLTSAEAGEYLKLRAAGKTDAQAKDGVAAMRAFVLKYGTPTPTAAETRFPKGATP